MTLKTIQGHDWYCQSIACIRLAMSVHY